MNEPILIVDDNPVNLKLSRVLLSLEGFEVRTAGDAVEALKMLEGFRPRLILMDLQMPGMDGLELTRRLKADPSHSEILIVAITAYAMKGDQEKALAAGCDGYVAKPIDTQTLPKVIRSLLGTGQSAAGQA
jgi:CheY-like chemotaxis protein